MSVMAGKYNFVGLQAIGICVEARHCWCKRHKPSRKRAGKPI